MGAVVLIVGAVVLIVGAVVLIVGAVVLIGMCQYKLPVNCFTIPTLGSSL